MSDSTLNLWLLGISTFGTLCIIGYTNLKVNQWMKKRITKIKRQNTIDVLNKNHLLTFGLSTEQCAGHMNREFDCGNLDCNYGRLRKFLQKSYLGIEKWKSQEPGGFMESLLRETFTEHLKKTELFAIHLWKSYILGLINNCQNCLDVCIYIITAKLFGDCIIKAHQRGVKVRVIADCDMSFSAQSLVNSFRATDIPTRQRMSPFIMHHKFVIVDKEVLINGSMNFTMTGAFCNWENVMITTQPELVDSFQNAFDALWIDFDPRNYSPIDGFVRPNVVEHQVVNL